MLSSNPNPSSAFIGGTSIPLKMVDEPPGTSTLGSWGLSLTAKLGDRIDASSIVVSLEDTASAGTSAQERNGHAKRHSFILDSKGLMALRTNRVSTVGR